MTVNQAQKWIDKLSTMRDAGILSAKEVSAVILARVTRLAMFGAEPVLIEFLQKKEAEWLVISEREFGEACREMMA